MSMRIFLIIFVCAVSLFAAQTESSNIFGEKEPVAKAFSEISERLAFLECLDLTYTSMVHSLQGDVIQSGSIIQEPPYRFRSRPTVSGAKFTRTPWKGSQGPMN